jgi:hypothetical protein
MSTDFAMLSCFITAAAENDIARLQQLRDGIAQPGAAWEYAARYDAVLAMRWLLSSYQKKQIPSASHLLHVCETACIDNASDTLLECVLNAVLNRWSWSKVTRYVAEQWEEAHILKLNQVYDQMNLKLWWAHGMIEQSLLPNDVVRRIVRDV